MFTKQLENIFTPPIWKLVKCQLLVVWVQRLKLTQCKEKDFFFNMLPHPCQPHVITYTICLTVIPIQTNEKCSEICVN